MPKFYQGQNQPQPSGFDVNQPQPGGIDPNIPDPGEPPELPEQGDGGDAPEVQTGPGALAAVVVGLLILGGLAVSSIRK